jgi:hypothetical protein
MMPGIVQENEMKRKIRRLKKLEAKIRFGHEGFSGKAPAGYVWDELFDLRAKNPDQTKYTMDKLLSMRRDEFRGALDEFFGRVYDRFYRENGFTDAPVFDYKKLAQLGLPYDAGAGAVKSRFRELAKIHHPDHGGDADRFKWLAKVYDDLMDNK